MNKYQRIALIAAATLIALLQLIGIGTYGLDDSKGWAISFLISAALFFVGLGSRDSIGGSLKRPKNDNHIDTNRLIRPGVSEKKDQVIVDILHGAVFKNAQDFYQYIKSKGYYHASGPIALILQPEVYSWFVGYAALYVLFLTSEKYRAKAAQLLVVRHLVIREARALSTKAWQAVDSQLGISIGESSEDDQASQQERKIFENHIQSLEAASRESIKNMTVTPVTYPYLPIYRIIGPVFGGIKDMDEQQLAERFNPIFTELLKKTGNVLNAL